jgi:hypothetical protein
MHSGYYPACFSFVLEEAYSYLKCVPFVFWDKLRLDKFVSRLTDLYVVFSRAWQMLQCSGLVLSKILEWFLLPPFKRTWAKKECYVHFSRGPLRLLWLPTCKCIRNLSVGIHFWICWDLASVNATMELFVCRFLRGPLHFNMPKQVIWCARAQSPLTG